MNPVLTRDIDLAFISRLLKTPQIDAFIFLESTGLILLENLSFERCSPSMIATTIPICCGHDIGRFDTKFVPLSSSRRPNGQCWCKDWR